MRYVEKRRIDSQQIFEIYYNRNFGLVPMADTKEALDLLCRFENMTYRRIERLAMYLASTPSRVQGVPVKEIVDELMNISIICLSLSKQGYVDTDSASNYTGGNHMNPDDRKAHLLDKKDKIKSAIWQINR